MITRKRCYTTEEHHAHDRVVVIRVISIRQVINRGNAKDCVHTKIRTLKLLYFYMSVSIFSISLRWTSNCYEIKGSYSDWKSF